jgi:K+-sensing histidine kinase KdpD
MVRVEVADTGIGIDPAALERMFEPFSRPMRRRRATTAAPASASRSPASSIERMGGRIGAEQRAGRRQHLLVRAPLAAASQHPHEDHAATGLAAQPR